MQQDLACFKLLNQLTHNWSKVIDFISADNLNHSTQMQEFTRDIILN